MKSLCFMLLLQLLSGAVWSQTCEEYMSAPNDNTSDALSDRTKTPLGFRRVDVPNHEEMRDNPCFTDTLNDTNQYVEITVQVTQLTSGSRICVRLGDGVAICGSNTVYLCDSAVSVNNVVTVTVLCDDACATVDQEVYYRIRLSPTLSDGQDNENWCMEQPQDRPSNLLVGFTPSITQPTTPSGSTTLHTLSLPLLLCIATIAGLWKYIY